jgi:segregation and condensation protein A
MPAPAAQGPSELASIDMYKLLDAFSAILKRVQGRSSLEVAAERITIHERMTQISDLLREIGSCTFDELFETDRSRYEVVVTFLAVLEMTKLRLTRIYQSHPSQPLHVEFAVMDADGPVNVPMPTADLRQSEASELDAAADEALHDTDAGEEQDEANDSDPATPDTPDDTSDEWKP